MLTSHEIEALRVELSTRLPIRARWLIGETPLDWDFSRAKRQLKLLTSLEFPGWDIPDEWRQFYLLGEENYSEGGGASPYLGVLAETGAVYELDVERDTRPGALLLNSSVTRFIDTFYIFDQSLGQGIDSPLNISGRVRALDPEVFNQSEWKLLAEYLESLSSRT